MNVNLGIWDKLAKLTVLLLFLLGVVGVALWYLPVIKQNERMRQQLLQSEARVKAEEERYRLLRIATEAARNNPKTIERLARANLGYAKPGEVVVRFEQPGGRR